MILILDTETTGVDETEHRLIEVAVARYDEMYGLIDCMSMLLESDRNEAEHVNHIRSSLLATYGNQVDSGTYDSLIFDAGQARCVVAHNASFDRKWMHALHHKPWVCSQRHIEWPNEQGRDVSLEKLALAHGVGVLPGHRAIYDVMTLVRVFDAVRGESTGRIAHLIDRALRPKAIYRAMVTYADNQLAKDEGYRWDADSKQWRKDMAIEDADAFVALGHVRAAPFAIQKVKDVP